VVPRFSFRAPDVIEVLDRVFGELGYPASVRVDQGSEYVFRDLDPWAYIKGVTLDFSARHADRQRVHRIVQRQVPGGTPESALIL
jgi:transposase InsO family protein